VPAGGIEDRIARAKLCLDCGCVHPGAESSIDLCIHCGTRLDGLTSEFPQALFDQPTVRAVRSIRISSEEEERVREGYHLTTQFRFPAGTRLRRVDIAIRGSEEVCIEATYVPQAELWRINHGWRRSAERNGFVIDANSGWWQSREDDDDDASPWAETRAPLTGLKPYVTDTRNILLLRPVAEHATDEAFLKTLAYALRRAIQIDYQIEEQEVAVELIGRDTHRRILMWEAAEGGIGVWERLIEEHDAFARVAQSALDNCHFEPLTGEPDVGWEERCVAACYDCLLSYSNQPDHRFLDRHLVCGFLLRLSRAEPAHEAAGRGYDEQYRWLREHTDPASDLERRFLDLLYGLRLRLPQFAQYCPSTDTAVQVDFYYQRKGIPGICIFLDGPQHDQPARAARDRQTREALQDLGFRVVAISHDRPLTDQIDENQDIFRAR
jgi:hypothetical protein